MQRLTDATWSRDAAEAHLTLLGWQTMISKAKAMWYFPGLQRAVYINSYGEVVVIHCQASARKLFDGFPTVDKFFWPMFHVAIGTELPVEPDRLIDLEGNL